MTARTGKFARIEESDPRVQRLKVASAEGLTLTEAARSGDISYATAYLLAGRYRIKFRRSKKARGVEMNIRAGVRAPQAPPVHTHSEHSDAEELRQYYTGMKRNLSRWF